MKGKTPSELDIPLLFPKDINKFDLYIISTQECLRSIGASIFNDSKEEWITAGEYINFLKRTDLGSQYPKERFEERIEKLVKNVSISLIARNDEGLIVCLNPNFSADQMRKLTDALIQRRHLR